MDAPPLGAGLGNAVIESWRSTLEFELRRIVHFTTKEQTHIAVAAWIKDYSTRRRRSVCQMMPPVAYEQRLSAGVQDGLVMTSVIPPCGIAGARPTTRSFLFGPPPGQHLRSALLPG